jgi:hypothetical protein
MARILRPKDKSSSNENPHRKDAKAQRKRKENTAKWKKVEQIAIGNSGHRGI